jgi:hypothetical protein
VEYFQAISSFFRQIIKNNSFCWSSFWWCYTLCTSQPAKMPKQDIWLTCNLNYYW